MNVAIRAESIGKLYMIGEHANARQTIKDAVQSLMTRALRRRVREDKARDMLWALRDVSFEAEKGEVIGVIGRNGAGKSTLLKVLAGITVPTEGRALLAGVVGSLLEVGTGFHPELTGRDNIFLNGAILGLKRAETRKRFDEIVDFAGVERFIDTPVKRYSSGMQVRLAFAVAAHLEPEILLIDEVLAVGDAEFQKRCLGKIEEVRSGGRTVIFVSHNMPMVVRLCPRVIFMEHGHVVADGHGAEVVRSYLDSGTGTRAAREWATHEHAPGDDVARLKAVRVRSEAGVTEDVDIRHSVSIEVEYWRVSDDPELRPFVTLAFTNEDGVVLFVSSEFTYSELWQRPRSAGLVCSTCTIPGNFLSEGHVYIRVTISSIRPPVAHVLEEDVVSFHVVDVSTGDGVRGDWPRDWPGVVRPMLPWTVTHEPLALAEDE